MALHVHVYVPVHVAKITCACPGYVCMHALDMYVYMGDMLDMPLHVGLQI